MLERMDRKDQPHVKGVADQLQQARERGFAWWEYARCRGMYPEIADGFFFPNGRGPINYAHQAAFCAGCPVSDFCVAQDLIDSPNGGRYGYRASTPSERDGASITDHKGLIASMKEITESEDPEAVIDRRIAANDNEGRPTPGLILKRAAARLAIQRAREVRRLR